MQIQGKQQFKTPCEMFMFGKYEYGFRGDPLPWHRQPFPMDAFEDDQVGEEEIGGFGVDWEALGDQGHEVGAINLPEHLNDIPIHDPDSPFSLEEWNWIASQLPPRFSSTSFEVIVSTWQTGRILAERLRPGFFS